MTLDDYEKDPWVVSTHLATGEVSVQKYKKIYKTVETSSDMRKLDGIIWNIKFDDK